MTLIAAIILSTKKTKMKMNLFLISIAALCILQISCGKEKIVEDPHNHTLLGKSLEQVRSEIRGDWYLVRGTLCGFAGCQTTYHNINSADIMSFLQNDTLKQTAHSGYPVYFYQKADSVIKNVDSWTFFYGLNDFTFLKVENDTLVGIPSGGAGSEIGLIRKP